LAGGMQAFWVSGNCVEEKWAKAYDKNNFQKHE
jgi:hypothetical protein